MGRSSAYRRKVNIADLCRCASRRIVQSFTCERVYSSLIASSARGVDGNIPAQSTLTATFAPNTFPPSPSFYAFHCRLLPHRAFRAFLCYLYIASVVMLPTYAFFWSVRQVRIRHRQGHACVRSPPTIHSGEVYTLTRYDDMGLEFAAVNLPKNAI